MQRALITGIAGFAGSHLAERLKGRYELWGTVIDDNLENLSGVAWLNLVKCDLLDPAMASKAVEASRPHVVFHLAAQSVPSVSYANPAETMRINIFSTLNLFEGVLKCAKGAVVVSAGSGDEYGEVEDGDLPLKEARELKPVNPYAVSKAAADLMAFQYWKSAGLKAVRCRPFNHLGPRQSEHFVASAFAKQIAEIESGLKDSALKVGNLSAHKDFLDVRDVAAAYELLAEKGAYGEVYNICSGTSVRISRILEVLLSCTDRKIEVIEDAVKMRPGAAVVTYGDPSRLKSLGWEPRHRIEDALKLLLDYWRERVKRQALKSAR